MDNGNPSPLTPQQRDAARALFGDRLELLAQLAGRLQQADPPAAARQAPDPGAFLRQIAVLYAEPSDRGQLTREIVRNLTTELMRLLKVWADATAPGDSRP